MKNRLLLCSIISMAVCLWALPSWSHEESTAPRSPWLAANRFTVTGGIGQFYEAASTNKLTSTRPSNVGFAMAQYTVAGGFSLVADWRRSVNGPRVDRAFVGVGFTLPIGSADR